MVSLLFSQYLLHFLLAFSHWVGEEVWQQSRVAIVAWLLLQDSFHTTLCLRHSAVEIATAVLYLALHCCKMDIVGNRTAKRRWWRVFSSSTSEDTLKDISREIMRVYDDDDKEYEKGKTVASSAEEL